MSASWIKICGLTTPEAVEAALAAQVDAIGFVFAQSVRRVTPQRALELAAPARGRVKIVAVTRHPSQAEVDEVVAVFKPDLFQTDAIDLQSLRLPGQLATLPVLRGAPTGAVPMRILFEGATSGSGVPCDWTAAQLVARQTELILAGGLNDENVVAAIAEVAPFGVDVSSGVEERPGVKSPAAIARFVAAARSAILDPTRLDCAVPLRQPIPTRR